MSRWRDRIRISGGFWLLAAWFTLVNGWQLLAVILSAAALHELGRLLVMNAHLGGGIEPGDIVIIRKESFKDGEPIVKRVIATEGQTVDIDFTAGAVYVDGQLLEEDYIRQPTYLEEGLEFPVTVPEGCVFVMGDNRNDSDDSRDPELGPVDTRQILGRAVFLLFPGVTADTDKRDFGRIGPLT